MPPQPGSAASLIVAISVVVVAALLALRQYIERRDRDPDLSEADAGHYARQDVRRALGVVVMLLLAIGVVVGDRVAPAIAVGRANPLFLRIWAGVFLLIFVLLVLALLDWIATRRYALRHRRAILRERIEGLRDELRRHQDRSGSNGPPGSLDGFPT